MELELGTISARVRIVGRRPARETGSGDPGCAM